ncbi:MAG TPA: YbaN family protein [Patescibacteria group bacterium]|nr:YbaN family protein [Patescibacteria group bacterium]
MITLGGISGNVKKVFFVVCGTIFLAAGLVGVVVPVLPTTPFLLLAAACYLRGSKRLHRWIMENPYFGEYLRNYVEGRGISRRQKVYTILFLWFMILFSIVVVVEGLAVSALLLLIASAVSIHVWTLPSLKEG